MTERRKLPNRRRNQVVRFDHLHPDTRMPSPHFATIGYYDDGQVGEIFLDAKKMATDVANLARDCALILSIALQYGVPIEEMRASVGRTEDGLPHTVIGSALDLLAGEPPIDPTPVAPAVAVNE